VAIAAKTGRSKINLYTAIEAMKLISLMAVSINEQKFS
jgi:hypothetical protein